MTNNKDCLFRKQDVAFILLIANQTNKLTGVLRDMNCLAGSHDGGAI